MTLIPAGALMPFHGEVNSSELTAGSFVTNSSTSGSIDTDNRRKKPGSGGKARVSIAVILIGALVFAIVLAWIEVMRSVFDDAFPTLSRRNDPNWVRYEGTLLRLGFAVVLTALSIMIIYFALQFVKSRKESFTKSISGMYKE